MRNKLRKMFSLEQKDVDLLQEIKDTYCISYSHIIHTLINKYVYIEYPSIKRNDQL